MLALLFTALSTDAALEAFIAGAATGISLFTVGSKVRRKRR